MTLHPNTIKRIVAAVVAFAAVLVAFDVINPQQAAACSTFVTAGIAACAAVWHPRHETKTRRKQ